jgi:hypothetical protein
MCPKKTTTQRKLNIDRNAIYGIIVLPRIPVNSVAFLQ